jgi:SecDF, P1 head subdomain
MSAARLSRVACTGILVFSLALAAFEAEAEPLHLVVASASAGADIRSGKPIVTVRLTQERGRLSTTLTLANLGRPIDIRINGKSVFKTVVREPITGGTFEIKFDEPEEAQRFAAVLSNQTALLDMEAAAN